MTSSGDSSVSYLCPQCQAKLTAQAGDAGQRHECPQCGKRVKVPGTPGVPSKSKSAGPHSPSPSPTDGIANIPLACPLCGTRMYATRAQVGETMVCPDCLESVVVPDRRTPKAPPQAPAPQSTQTPASTPAKTDARTGAATNAPDDAPASEDEFQLSDPIDLPRHRSVTRAMADLIDEQAVEDEEPHGTVGSTPTAPMPKPPPQFAVKCPTCDTMLQAADSEIGSLKECPDCFSSFTIKRPRSKPQRVSPVELSEGNEDEFVLGEPAVLDVFRPTDDAIAPRSVGEEALQRAREAQVERELEDPGLPLAPLWTGVLNFLPNVAAITRVVVSGVLLGTSTWLLLADIRLITTGDPGQMFFGMAGSILFILLVTVALSYAGASVLTVLQESAEGCDQIESWPENSLAEWIGESFAVLMAVFFACLPGMLPVILLKWAGMEFQGAWIVAGVSLYLFFPIVQLSLLETASMVNPISGPIIESLRNEFLLWATFYIITLFAALVAAIAFSSVHVRHPLPVFVLTGIFLALIGFLYFRMLGRLAWACQMRPLREEQKKKKKNRREKSRRSKGASAKGAEPIQEKSQR